MNTPALQASILWQGKKKKRHKILRHSRKLRADRYILECERSRFLSACRVVRVIYTTFGAKQSTLSRALNTHMNFVERSQKMNVEMPATWCEVHCVGFCAVHCRERPSGITLDSWSENCVNPLAVKINDETMKKSKHGVSRGMSSKRQVTKAALNKPFGSTWEELQSI